MRKDQNKVEQVLNLLNELSVDELEQVSRDLKKMLLRCRVQEKIDLRREDVARRIGEVVSHRRAGGD